MLRVRPPAVAGTFYSAVGADLMGELNVLLDRPGVPTAATPPKAIIVPHAGYIYSGLTAAAAYVRLAPLRYQIRRIVLMGPAHRVAVRGLALPEAEAFATPLGVVAIDKAAHNDIAALSQVVVSAPVHALEHSLEVQLPFLQRTLENFRLLPLVVGDAGAEEVAEVLDRMWGGDETLIVVSSDLSHYLPYAEAQRIDRATAQAILDLDADIPPHHACGAIPINALLLTARRRGLRSELLDLRNSGDTAGDHGRVVGYASFAFYEVPRDH
jgi:hypothetical protein